MRDEDGMILMILETLMTDPTNDSGKVYWVSFEKSSSQRSSTELKDQPLKGTLEGTGLQQVDHAKSQKRECHGIRHWHQCC